MTQPWSYCVCMPEIGPADASTEAFTSRTSLLVMRVLLPTALFQPHIATQKLVQTQVVRKTVNEMHPLVLRNAVFGAIAVDCADALGGCSAIYPNRAHSLEHICSLQSLWKFWKITEWSGSQPNLFVGRAPLSVC